MVYIFHRVVGVAWVPNCLTFFRIVVAPVIIVLHGAKVSLWAEASFVLFLLGAFSDYFDGYFARKYKIVSKIGKCLDPIADKIFVLCVFLVLIDANVVSVICSAVILSREFFISGIREYLAKKDIEVSVSRLSKWKTGVQMTSLGMYLFLFSNLMKGWFLKFNITSLFLSILPFLADALMFVATFLSVLTAYFYLRANFRHII